MITATSDARPPVHPREEVPPALAPSEQAAAAKGALQHAAARLPTAVSFIAAAPLARLEKSSPDVAAGACSPDSCEALACQGLHELQRAR